MGSEKKRHLYYDQQKPLQEPVDAEHASIPQEMFARRPPNKEDDYIFEEEQAAMLQRRKSLKFKTRTPKIIKKQRPLKVQHRGLWERIYNALYKRFNSHWKP